MQWIRDHVSKRGVLITVAVLALVFVIMQFVGPKVTNPPVQQGPKWDSPRTEALARTACFDCHSNETETYWWEDIAPISYWIANHVDEGREALNFSECTGSGGESDDAAETVKDGSMPPDYYTWFGLHSDANLTAKERQQLADGLRKTLAGAGCGGEGGD